MIQAISEYDQNLSSATVPTAKNRFESIARKLTGLGKLWFRRAQSRRHLAQLDNRQLEDIGIDRAAAQIEIDKSFWSK